MWRGGGLGKFCGEGEIWKILKRKIPLKTFLAILANCGEFGEFWKFWRILANFGNFGELLKNSKNFANS